ncbi:hypothetical protein BH23ACT2_BH23ACT2_09870 [soil metagenome]
MRTSQRRSSATTLEGWVVGIDEAMVRWDRTHDHSHLDDGSALLLLRVDVTNGTGRQQCMGSSGRDGIEPTITLPDGTSRTTEGIGVRCLGEGEEELDVAMGFESDDDDDGVEQGEDGDD